jgi:hypothetical protein
MCSTSCWRPHLCKGTPSGCDRAQRGRRMQQRAEEVPPVQLVGPFPSFASILTFRWEQRLDPSQQSPQQAASVSDKRCRCSTDSWRWRLALNVLGGARLLARFGCSGMPGRARAVGCPKAERTGGIAHSAIFPDGDRLREGVWDSPCVALLGLMRPSSSFLSFFTTTATAPRPYPHQRPWLRHRALREDRSYHLFPNLLQPARAGASRRGGLPHP